MAADVDISRFLHPLDLVTPVEAALRLHESRENEKTQRMFAQSQMARQSAQDFRDERDHREKVEATERQRKIDQATALGTIQTMMRQPGGTGPAQALGSAYGIDVNPLTATTAAANGPSPGDAVDQLLASPAGVAAAAPAVGPGPAEGPTPPPGVASGGMAPVLAGSQEGRPEPLPGRPIEGPVELGGDPLGNGPPQPVEGPMPAPPVPRATPADLEALMARAAPAPAAKPPEAPPMPLLYEAVMGGKHYPISTEQQGTGLGDKYDAVFKSYLSQGAKPADAFKAVLAEKEKDDSGAATEHRMMEVLGGRNAQQDSRDASYRMTVEEQQARDAARLANSQKVARINAAGRGAATPQAEAALAHMIGMKEQGAGEQEIAQYAADNHVDPKIWNAPIKNVQTEASAATRANERRAGQEVTDADGKVIGVAKTPQAAADLNKKTAAWSQLQTRYQALIDDVKQNGTRVNPLDIDAGQRRDSLAASAAAAARVYNGLGATDASQKLEAEILGARGTIGHGIIKGANSEVLQHVYDEASKQHQARLNVGMRAGGGEELPAVLTHKKAPAAAATEGDDDAILNWARSLPGARK